MPRLRPEQLVTRCDAAELGFETTTELERGSGLLGQARATEALQLSLAMSQSGFNAFILGEPGSGRKRLTRLLVADHANRRPVPGDWCYVHNFDDSRRPRAMCLPPGTGRRLRKDMSQLVEELQESIPALFESKDYLQRRKAIENEVDQQHEQAVEQIVSKAKDKGVGVSRTQQGIVLGILKDGNLLGPEEVQKLPEQERKQLEAEAESIQRELEEALQQVPALQREKRKRVRELDRQMTRSSVSVMLAEMRRRYSSVQQILEYLDAVEESIVEEAASVLREQSSMAASGNPLASLRGLQDDTVLKRYQVNVLVDRAQDTGAPIVWEDHPAVANLVGRIEFAAQLGTPTTDFTMLKPGALHRANGGYLILDARKLLSQPFAWEHLKRSLYSQRIRIESVGESMGLAHPLTLEPEDIELDVKVVVVGERWIYYLLQQHDPEFAELFKIASDFEDTLPRNADNARAYAQVLAGMIEKEQLHPMAAGAVARAIDHSARLADDASKFSMRVRPVFDIVREADHICNREGGDIIQREHVSRAIDQMIRRSARLEEQVHESIARRIRNVSLSGTEVGQVNGLSVLPLSSGAFGFPARISARARLGSGELVDIEREVELGGPVHSKGVLILAGFLGARYTPDRPLSLKASLGFEQSYGMVDGDSASLAELLALLSAIGEIPIRQSVAATGSIDQHGNVQAVGGINEKIEGFYKACKQRELDGKQGVIIPAANIEHLMLDDEVIEAVRSERFFVHTVSHLDEAVPIASELAPGTRDASGAYPSNSFNGRIEAHLTALSEAAQKYGKSVETPKDR